MRTTSAQRFNKRALAASGGLALAVVFSAGCQSPPAAPHSAGGAAIWEEGDLVFESTESVPVSAECKSGETMLHDLGRVARDWGWIIGVTVVFEGEGVLVLDDDHSAYADSDADAKPAPVRIICEAADHGDTINLRHRIFYTGSDPRVAEYLRDSYSRVGK
jgi:hypothetical protein